MTDAEIREMAGAGPAPAAGQVPLTSRQLISAVLEAIDIPYGASAGDEPAYLRVLAARVMRLTVTLKSFSNKSTQDWVDWGLQFLHEQLLSQPECAVNYETDYAKVLARLRGEAAR